jgi:hypothetical protein
MGEGANEVNRDELRGADDREDFTSGAATNGEPAANADDTAYIRADIEQTRAEMSETIDAIQERLSPQHLTQQVKETVREATIGRAEEMARQAGDTINEARYGMMETIRHNPIPAAMVGIGLGWLFMNRRSAPRHTRYADYGRYRGAAGYYDGPYDYAGQPGYPVQPGYPGGPSYAYPAGQREHGGMMERGQRLAGDTAQRVQHAAGSAASRAQDAASSAASRVQDAAGSAASRVQDAASTIADRTQETVGGVVNEAQERAGWVAGQAQYQAQRLEDRFERTLYESPLAVGAIALALGAAAGFVLPQTRRENELMGETRDNLVERAQEVAQEAAEKVQRVASDVADDVKLSAEERAREHGLAGERTREQEMGGGL